MKKEQETSEQESTEATGSEPVSEAGHTSGSESVPDTGETTGILYEQDLG